ncbi:Peroxiredoxin-like 2a [Thalictrum thalictroides]|uniref:Peroxiredoxin-like 2A n=1 Tax=Thalictrum thalictroides TaxID=46969 RepID=A0A7J6WVS2_THATH|nr:Peroxiredoxin-like 2a [Thalictrum thalictroides]
MASFVMEEFVGNGLLKELLPKLMEEGWDDVPTLKMMNLQDMDAINMTPQQKDALEIRSYLHDRGLMQYGDKLEASGKSLQELLSNYRLHLSSQFGIRRGHISRFTDRTSQSIAGNDLLSVKTTRLMTIARSIERSNTKINSDKRNVSHDLQECSYVKSLPAVDNINIAPYSAIENISVQKLAPVYKIGQENLVQTKTTTVKASELWRDKPALLLCVRRPGCIMCRAEAHQLYAKKPIFDALGIQLIAVLHEEINSEVKDYWPRYWGGMVVLDRNKDFFKALGGGKLLKNKLLTGFLLNAKAIANFKRAKSMGIEQSFKGEGEIKGGLFVVASGKTGIACQFAEKNFGDWAPLAEIVQVCTQLQRQLQH